MPTRASRRSTRSSMYTARSRKRTRAARSHATQRSRNAAVLRAAMGAAVSVTYAHATSRHPRVYFARAAPEKHAVGDSVNDNVSDSMYAATSVSTASTAALRENVDPHVPARTGAGLSESTRDNTSESTTESAMNDVVLGNVDYAHCMHDKLRSRSLKLVAHTQLARVWVAFDTKRQAADATEHGVCLIANLALRYLRRLGANVLAEKGTSVLGEKACDIASTSSLKLRLRDARPVTGAHVTHEYESANEAIMLRSALHVASQQAERIVCAEAHFYVFLCVLGVQHGDAEAWMCLIHPAQYNIFFDPSFLYM